MNAPYEAPESPDARLLTAEMLVDEEVREIHRVLMDKKFWEAI